MRKTKYDYSKNKIQQAVDDSKSISGTLINLGMPLNGGVRRVVIRKIKEYSIDTSHHIGQGFQPSGTTHNKLDWQDILVNNGKPRKASQLRRAMIEYGHLYKCALCECEPLWLGKELVLQVDHKNGDHNDNTPENVWFLCPNCHTQTDNWGVKNMLTIVE